MAVSQRYLYRITRAFRHSQETVVVRDSVGVLADSLVQCAHMLVN